MKIQSMYAISVNKQSTLDQLIKFKVLLATYMYVQLELLQYLLQQISWCIHISMFNYFSVIVQTFHNNLLMRWLSVICLNSTIKIALYCLFQRIVDIFSYTVIFLHYLITKTIIYLYHWH